ncbi:unnamed protein product [Ostreobium quekettii]|uniref:Uncharacterized protein n=1 Tax=Ostreobium quekettii TaxID=121088 RepID=A0A8S1J5G5_9CHLO|nr:unnamed protein product [Ostreobium quekettii]|eukprot:evm.model.scf_1565.3 EVM.evm.TU.scf_1565.3   scf_1565:10710-11563(-)
MGASSSRSGDKGIVTVSEKPGATKARVDPVLDELARLERLIPEAPKGLEEFWSELQILQGLTASPSVVDASGLFSALRALAESNASSVAERQAEIATLQARTRREVEEAEDRVREMERGVQATADQLRRAAGLRTMAAEISRSIEALSARLEAGEAGAGGSKRWG